MRSILWTVLKVELRQLLRDRRALVAAVVLPALLYPLFFWSQTEIKESSREILAAREVNLALDLSRADGEVAEDARARLAQRTPITLIDVDADELVAFEEGEALELELAVAQARRRAILRELGGAHAVVTAVPHAAEATRTLFRVYFQVKDDDAREAADRAAAALGELRHALAEARRDELLGSDPAGGLDLEAIDVASAADAGGAKIGRLLPLLSLLVLLSGGSYAALAVFAGERESQTLETLLVQPTPSAAIVRGKFLAVMVAGMVTLAANLASLLGTVAAGLGEFPGMDGSSVAGIGLGRLAAGLVYLPGCVLLCALLCLVCGRARTFREGQQTLLPVMIVTALPTVIAMQPGLETSPLLAAVPFTGPALCFRDALAGNLTAVAAVVMTLSHALWAGLLLSRLGVILDAERVLSAASTEAEQGLRRASAAHARRWGFVSVLAMYVVGTRLQAWDLKWGLLLTLWVLVPLLALGAAGRARHRGGGELPGELGLRRPAILHVIGALLCVPAAVWAVTQGLLPMQMELLPMPSGAGGEALAATIESWSTLLVVFLMAISPGVCEELLFRGALLSSLRRDLKPLPAIAWQALFFAAMHLSVYRLLPTFLLGLVLGALTLRARSLWPAVVAHAAYNALTVLGAMGRLEFAEASWWAYTPWLAPIGLALFFAENRRKS